MSEIIITEQADYDAVPTDFDGLIIIKGRVRLAVVPKSAHVVAMGSAHVVAGQWCSVHKMRGHIGAISGGVVLVQPELATTEDWCAYHGVAVKDGVAVLYKGVRDNYHSAHDCLYAPGSVPISADWDGGDKECGGGLHFCPFPAACFRYDEQATRFVACPVALADMRTPRSDDQYPDKIKARGCCGPVYEVDRYGKAV